MVRLKRYFYVLNNIRHYNIHAKTSDSKERPSENFVIYDCIRSIFEVSATNEAKVARTHNSDS